jgi:hypothetical protein
LTPPRQSSPQRVGIFRTEEFFTPMSIRASVVRRSGVDTSKETAMRFMMIVKLPAYGGPPDKKELHAMGRYNDEIRRAGVLIEVNGLAPAAEGSTVRFGGTQRTVIDGPFSEAKEVIGGYWLIQVGSKEEALEWAKRIPFGTEVHPGQAVEVELRRITEASELS